jgi:hypothetical protein
MGVEVFDAHWHPTDEQVTVLSGTLALGMGDTFDKVAMKDLPAGGYALLPADMRHFAMATTAATVQVSGAGPFALTYMNPADDPTRRSGGKYRSRTWRKRTSTDGCGSTKSRDRASRFC